MNENRFKQNMIIDTDFSSSSSIPVKVKTCNGVHTREGNSLKDDILQFKIDNEVGAYLEVLQSTASNKVYITLRSKTGQELSTINFINDSSAKGLSEVTLNYAQKKMYFKLLDQTVLSCDLSILIDKITALENKRLEDIPGIIDGGVIV